MKEIIYDILVGFVILGILYIAIGLFRGNLIFISKSAETKKGHSQLQEETTVNSLYTGNDIVAYLKSFTQAPSKPITVKIESQTLVISSNDALWSGERDTAVNYIQSGFLGASFTYTNSTRTYTKN